jgi:hypothetical protein
MAQIRNDGVLEKPFEQRFPLYLALYKAPSLLLLLQIALLPHLLLPKYLISTCISKVKHFYALCDLRCNLIDAF